MVHLRGALAKVRAGAVGPDFGFVDGQHVIALELEFGLGRGPVVADPDAGVDDVVAHCGGIGLWIVKWVTECWGGLYVVFGVSRCELVGYNRRERWTKLL